MVIKGAVVSVVATESNLKRRKGGAETEDRNRTKTNL
jgi:hypothetical protein